MSTIQCTRNASKRTIFSMQTAIETRFNYRTMAALTDAHLIFAMKSTKKKFRTMCVFAFRRTMRTFCEFTPRKIAAAKCLHTKGAQNRDNGGREIDETLSRTRTHQVSSVSFQRYTFWCAECEVCQFFEIPCENAQTKKRARALTWRPEDIFVTFLCFFYKFLIRIRFKYTFLYSLCNIII